MARQSINSDWPYRWDLLLRYRLIEIVALWEGRLTSNSLMTAFGIQRQQASRDINTYRTDVAPDNLVYDQQLKGYKPTNNFSPMLTKGVMNEYLHLLNSRTDLTCRFEQLNIQQANIEVIQPLSREASPEIIRPMVKACREQSRLEIQYASLSNPVPEIRVVSPHTLIYNGFRWHVRAHCEKNNDFRDFVLSRITDIPDFVTKSERQSDEDTAWTSQVVINVIPDPRMTPHQRQVIARDYGMKSERMEISTRGALFTIICNRLGLTTHKL
jgi:predicted DNA-binding transcriptional regulator YafY